MSLYPEGHPPFIARGLCLDEFTAETIQCQAEEPTLKMCLNSAVWDLGFSRSYLEQLRACLFRAEQLIDTQRLPAKDFFFLLPYEVPALLESLKAAEKCLEEWLESETCKRILEKYPKRPRTERRDKA